MLVFFVAGSYRAKTEWEVKQNIQAAEHVAVTIWRAGHVAVCPHKNTAYFGGACAEQVWLDGYLELLERCDALVLVPGWEGSAGTKGEIARAYKMGMEVLTLGQFLKRYPESR